jgi:aminoglycoside phosphotransferase (APT) family kinase protein
LYTGEIEGWSYLVMMQLAGHASREVWASIGARDRREIISRLGVAMSELHAHAAPLSQIALDRDWCGFIERQARTRSNVSRLAAQPLNGLKDCPATLPSVWACLPTNHRQVFLHGDIHAGNLAAARKDGHWQITG